MKRIGAVLLLVISVFCLFVVPVFADEEDTAHVCQICGETHDLSQLSFTNKIAYEMSERIYGGGYMEWAKLKTLPIGDGHVDFKKFFDFLAEKEYNGDFTVEATAFDRETGEVDTDMLNRCFAAIREGVKR